MLEAIYDADLAAGGDSFWIDRILQRPAGGSGGDLLYTKGRALYMYTHDEDELGFAGQGTGANQGGGGFAYREAIMSGVTDLYTVEIDGADLDEDESARQNSPSHWSSVHNGGGLSVAQHKFITHNNVAVTILEVTNTGDEATTRIVTAATPGVVTQQAEGDERTGSFTTRWDLTTVTTRFSGDGFAAGEEGLTSEITLDPGETVTVKLQLGAITDEIAESGPEYERYRDLDPAAALQTQLAEYNQWWVDNVPYIDVPDENVKKMSYYRTFLNRFNYFDANVPGNDFQFPVSVEGALGYNNAIQLTQPMHMQDLKYFRDPIYAYGNLFSSGETSRCAAFTDNPGGHSWGNTYEQYIAREGWNAFQVHGGDDELVENFAFYAECDVEGQIDKYDTNANLLIEYSSGFLTGNDADTPTFHWPQQQGLPVRQDRAEAAFQWSGAVAAADAYALLGQDDKAAEMTELADSIKESILTLLWDDAPAEPEEGRPGQVFKHRLTANDSLVPWKDHQNFAPFIEGLVPTDDPAYREALRYYADAAEFPIMPFYTANQADKAESGFAGSNNFSNINSTLQAQVFSQAIREYPSQYVTNGMYRALLDWLTWVQYVGGDNRLPNNNEFFFNWNPDTQNFGRSGIHHNILGSYNFMIIDDAAGVRPRLDDVLELWPIDVGWDYFAVNNLNYHGKDLTVVWDGVDHYGDDVPDGFSAYLDGRHVLTADKLAHVTWDAESGEATVLDDSGAEILFSLPSHPTEASQCRNGGWQDFWNPSFRNQGRCIAWVEAPGNVPVGDGDTTAPLVAATDVTLVGNERMVDMLQKAGRDISSETGDAENLAEGQPVDASFTASNPAARATAPEHAVSGFTVSGLPAQAGGNNFSRPGYVSPNTIWGTEGSPNAEDWLEVDLGSPQQIDNIKVYFYSDKEYNPQQNHDGGTYREPLVYRLQYHDGSDWVNIWGHRSSERPLPNLNEVRFPRVTAERVRLLVTPQNEFGVGVKEIQVFNTGVDVEPLTEPQVLVTASPTSGLEPLTVQFTGIAEDPQGGEVTVEWDFGDGQTSDELSPEHIYELAGSYTATLTATDSDGEIGSASVDIEVIEFDGNHAPFGTATCSVTSPWENCPGINSGVDPTTSNPGIGVGWGTWPNGGTQWMQLDWDEPITTDRTEVYWYQDSQDGDGVGVKRPGEWILQYWDAAIEDWVDVANPSGFETELNQYNVTTHDVVTTTAMRVTVETREDAVGVGALQWKVFEPDDG